MGLKTRSQDPPPLYTVLNAKNNFYVFKRLKKLRSTVCCGMTVTQNPDSRGTAGHTRARPVTPGTTVRALAGLLLHCASGVAGEAHIPVLRLFKGFADFCLRTLTVRAPRMDKFRSHWARRKRVNIISKSSGTEASPSRSNSGTGPSAAASLLCREHGQNPHFRIFHLLSSRSRILFQNTLCLLPYFFQVFLQMAPSQ